MQRLHRVLVLSLTIAFCVATSGCASFDGGAPLDSPPPLSDVSGESSDDIASSAALDASDERRQPSDPLQVSDFYPSNIGTTIKRLSGNGPDRGVAQQLYEEAEALYDEAVAEQAREAGEAARESFIEAGAKYAAAANRWPDSALEEDALFRAGESLFFADRYVKANERFEELLEKYPNSRYLDLVSARRFEIAQYWIKLDDADGAPVVALNLTDKQRPWSDTFGHAIRIYDKMRLDDPTGKLADDATIAAANAHFARGNFLDADQYYTDLRRHFPSSEHQFMAHYLGIQAKLRSYRGPEYAGEILDEAEKLAKQVRRQFPSEFREHDVQLEKAYREIRYRQAEREWTLANYYYRRRHYGAARFYYNLILKDYDDTPYADEARAKLLETSGKPRTPPQRLAWLVELFPDEKSSTPVMTSAEEGTSQR